MSLLRSLYERRDVRFGGWADLVYRLGIAVLTAVIVLMLLAPGEIAEALR